MPGDLIRVWVTLHGLFRIGTDDPDRRLELTVPEGTDVRSVVAHLHGRSPMLDPRACLAMVRGSRVKLDQQLADEDHVHLYPTFTGG